MPRIKAFQALRPVPELAVKVASVPYDVVNRDEAAELAAGNPLSFLHVVRPDIDFPAKRIRMTLRSMRREQPTFKN